jgi:hypothetical protein
MSYKVIPTIDFQRCAKPLLKKYPSLKNDLKVLFDSLIENPTQGILIRQDCYKIRLAISSKGKGKSGGARVVTFVKVVSERVYLLTIFDKSDKENITDADLDSYIEEALDEDE